MSRFFALLTIGLVACGCGRIGKSEALIESTPLDPAQLETCSLEQACSNTDQDCFSLHFADGSAGNYCAETTAACAHNGCGDNCAVMLSYPAQISCVQ